MPHTRYGGPRKPSSSGDAGKDGEGSALEWVPRTSRPRTPKMRRFTRPSGERPELVAEEAERHRHRDGDRLASQVAERRGSHERLEHGQVDQQPRQTDSEEARRLEGRVAITGLEGPVPVPEEVVGHRYAEGPDRGGEAMQVEVVGQHREDGQVDQIAGAAYDAELQQLQPTRRTADGGAEAIGELVGAAHRLPQALGGRPSATTALLPKPVRASRSA